MAGIRLAKMSIVVSRARLDVHPARCQRNHHGGEPQRGGLHRHGLLTDDMSDLQDFQMSYARSTGEVAGWDRNDQLGGIDLAEVVRRVHPTILIGTSTRANAFTEDVSLSIGLVSARSSG